MREFGMRILVLCKRRYMHKDVIDDRYGRLYELPAQLARRGHQVLGVCLSYRPRPTGYYHRHVRCGRGFLLWRAFNALPGGPAYLPALLALARRFRPDLVLGCSDSFHVIVGDWLARRLGCPYVVDLYDNFESFGLSKLPGVRPAFRRALRRAWGVSCVSEPLAEKVVRESGNSNVLVLESTIDAARFYPRDKHAARRRLGMPEDGLIIGTAGALYGNRGIDLLYEAFESLAGQMPDLYLALAGPVDRRHPLPKHDRLIYLGLLPHAEIPDFYSALDLGIVCMVGGEFGNYAFPQKTYEIMACRTPVLVAAVEALGRKLAAFPACLYQPGDLGDFLDKLQRQLQVFCVPDIDIPTWADQGRRLEMFCQQVLNRPVA